MKNRAKNLETPNEEPETPNEGHRIPSEEPRTWEGEPRTTKEEVSALNDEEPGTPRNPGISLGYIGIHDKPDQENTSKVIRSIDRVWREL